MKKNWIIKNLNNISKLMKNFEKEQIKNEMVSND